MRVLLDSNVLIAASVFVASVEDFESPFKHRFFDDSMQLIGLIKKHIGKRIGVVTSTIEAEVHSVLNKAVIKTLRECRPYATHKKIYDLSSYVLNKCEDRLNNILSIMVREPVLAKQKTEYLLKVNQMYNELIQRAREIDVQDIAYRRARGDAKRYRPDAYEIHLEQEKILNEQLLRLLTKKASPTDKEILAEAAVLNQYYKEIDKKGLCLASCDLVFSPMGPKYSSRIVTDEILNRFKVVCHWPLEIAKQLNRQLK